MYKLLKCPITGKDINVFQLDTGYVIPLDASNSDYQKYLKWLEEGNTPLPADEPNEGTV